MDQPPLIAGRRGPGRARGGAARRRRGLAPLEFVLWLPVLMFVAALMVNFGTAATWRIRGETVSRDAVWRARWPRSSRNEGRPPIWRAAAGEMRTAGDAAFSVLDDRTVWHEVVRGPQFRNLRVHPLLNPARGAVKGVSGVRREYPLLPRLGDYDSGDVDNRMLDDKWQHGQMGIPNRYRRIKVLYELPKTDPQLPQAFLDAVSGMFSIPHYSALSVLDDDQDVRRYWGRADFHPNVLWRRYCEMDRDVVRRVCLLEPQGGRSGRYPFPYDDPLVDTRLPTGEIRLGEISKLPSSMTSLFLGMYRRREQQILAALDSVPPPPPQIQAQLLAELADIQRKIAQLEAYQARMPEIEAALRDRADAAI